MGNSGSWLLLLSQLPSIWFWFWGVWPRVEQMYLRVSKPNYLSSEFLSTDLFSVPWEASWTLSGCGGTRLPMIYYLSLPPHLPPQHQNDHYPQLLIAAPGLAKARPSHMLGFANERETGPSRLPSISDHADLQLWINADSSGHPGGFFPSYASALRELNIV